jgi:hypothetical protein
VIDDTRYSGPAVGRVPTSGEEKGKGRERTRGRMVVATKTEANANGQETGRGHSLMTKLSQAKSRTRADSVSPFKLSSLVRMRFHTFCTFRGAQSFFFLIV